MKKLNSATRLLDDVQEATLADGLTIGWQHDDFGHGEIHLEWDGDGSTVLPLLVLPGLTARTIGPVLATADPGSLVVTEHVTAALASQLRQGGFAYLDSAGNAHVRRPGLFVDIRGRRASTPQRPAPLLTRAAVPVLLCILNQPDLVKAPLRALVVRTPASLGTVQKVKASLLRRFEPMLVDGRDDWQRQLALDWSTYYLDVYRPALEAQRYSTALGRKDLREVLRDVPAVLSGEYAAESMGFDLVPGTCDLYVDTADIGQVRQALRLRRDPEGPITVRRLFWDQETLSQDRGEPGSTIAPRALVWSDLVAIDDPRVRDVAKAMGGGL